MEKYPKPFTYWTTYAGHGGVDYPQDQGTPILAVTNGVISFSGWWNDRAGNTRTLLTDDGVKLVHCHLVNLAGPRIGSRVRAGEIIGYVGSTGHSTGDHLHQEVYVNGVKQSGDNYWRYIDKNRTISASGSGSGSGGGSVPVPNPPKPIVEMSDEMYFNFVTDSVDGNDVPGWAVINPGYAIGRNNPQILRADSPNAQENANSWARSMGKSASVCNRQDFLNLIELVRGTQKG